MKLLIGVVEHEAGQGDDEFVRYAVRVALCELRLESSLDEGETGELPWRGYNVWHDCSGTRLEYGLVKLVEVSYYRESSATMLFWFVGDDCKDLKTG